MKKIENIIIYIVFLVCVMIPFSCSALTITVDLDTASDEDLLQLLDMIHSKLKNHGINTIDVIEEKTELDDNKTTEMNNTQVDDAFKSSVKETNTLFESNAWVTEDKAKLRKEPSFASGTICELEYQQKIYVIEEVDNYVKWYHVKLDNETTGYVLAVQVVTESNSQELKQDDLSNKNNSSNNSRQKPVNVEVSISSVRFEDTGYGGRNIFIRFKNNGSKTVDRIDFEIKGYNRYGERISSYGKDIVTGFYDYPLAPGSISSGDAYYHHYMFDEIASIKVAIVKYHLKNGTTVIIPEYQQEWKTYKN